MPQPFEYDYDHNIFKLIGDMKEMELGNPEVIIKLIQILTNKVKSLKKTFKKSKSQSKRKLYCSSNLKKCDLAYMFYILMDEGILFFDEFDNVRNRAQMQHFIERNFSYRGDGGVQMTVQSVSREFSEAKGYTYSEKQGRLLDRIIKRLEIRKQRISHIQK